MRNTLTCMLVLAFFSSPVALAQGTTMTPPTMGTGTGTGVPPVGSPGASGRPSDLDLPMQAPVYVNPNPTPTPPPPTTPTPTPPPADDPRDMPPPVIFGEEIDSETDTLYYVIDISCSMGWDNRSYTTLDGQLAMGLRIDRAKCELSRSVLGLSSNFSFNIVAYDCGTRMWRSTLQEANDANKAAALAWINALMPVGATGTGPAMALGLADKMNMSVVLLTDGAPNCGVPDYSIPAHRTMIRAANTQAATINVFGIAASGEYRTFCQNVAADAGGAYFDVP
jgi:hypothetical protein